MLRVSVRWRLAAAAIPVLLLATLVWIRHEALGARARAAQDAIAANRIPVSVAAVDIHENSLSEPIASAAEFRDAAVFRGRVYLCSPEGLFGYDADGTLEESYRTGRELPSGELTALDASPAGLLLTTAGAGLLSFDGNRVRQILPADAHSRNFSAVLGLGSGKVLVGTTERGVLVWNGKTLEEFLSALARAHVTVLAGSDADLWIGTLETGAWRLHAGQLDHVLADLPDPHVLSIAVTGATAYVGTPVGVVEFHDGRKSRTLAEGYFARALESDEETLVVGTEDEGIVTIPLREAIRPGRELSEAAIKAPVARIFSMAGVRYALAGGLYRLDAQRNEWRQALSPEKGALTDRNIAALSVGRDGRVWVGYFDRGLDVADAGFDMVRHFEDEHLFCVNRIVEDPDGGRTAVATANGLVMVDASLTVRQVLGRKDGLLADHVTDVMFRRGGMVVATPAGLSIADRSGIRSLYVLQGLVNNHVYALASAGNRIAAGTLGGLSLLANDVVEANYTTANSGLGHNWISALQPVGGDWFVGTYGAGVMRLDASGRWSAFPDLKGGFDVNPNAMAQTADAVYVGSLGGGLWVYAKSTGRWTNRKDGLPSLNVTAIAAGGGYVYVGTDNGLVRYREGALL